MNTHDVPPVPAGPADSGIGDDVRAMLVQASSARREGIRGDQPNRGPF